MNSLDYLNQIFNKQEPVLKDMFATLFMHIIQDIESGVEIINPHLIDELKGYPHEMDLSATLGRFTYDHFSLDSIKKISGARSFSLLNLHAIFNRKPLSHHQDRKRLRGIVSKTYTLVQYQEFSSIADNIIMWRHKHAHNNGIRNSSQALVLFALISLFLKIYPDKLRDQINGITEFDAFINVDCMGSIGVFSSDLETESEDIPLIENIKSDSNELIDHSSQIHESLLNLNFASNDQTQTMHHAIARIENIEMDIQQMSIALNETNHYFNKKHEDEVKAAEEDEARAKAENLAWHQRHAGEILNTTKKDIENGIPTGLESASLDLIIGDGTVIELDESEIVMSNSYEYEREDGELVQTGIQHPFLTDEAREKYFPSDSDIAKPDLKIVPDHTPDEVSNEFSESLVEDEEQNISLTKAEIEDQLQLLRREIQQHMKSEYKEFENWHNILMKALIKELTNNHFNTPEEFKDSDAFRHYYNSGQKKGKALEHPAIVEQKNNARIFMDYQLEKYWPRIHIILTKGSN